jgi:hypothetical protein
MSLMAPVFQDFAGRGSDPGHPLKGTGFQRAVIQWNLSPEGGVTGGVDVLTQYILNW